MNTEILPSDVFKVSVKDIAELAEMDPKSAYEQLKRAAESLQERILIVKLPLNVNKRKPEENLRKINWTSSCEYDAGEGEIKIKFGNDFIPYISELERDFTKYKLEDVRLFKASYSIRLYELFVKWEGNSKEISLAWLKGIFMLSDKYQRVGDLKKCILDVAVEEINQYSDMEVSYEQVKRGRNVVGFLFKYKIKKKKLKAPRRPTKKQIEKEARPGESYQDVEKRLSNLKRALK